MKRIRALLIMSIFLAMPVLPTTGCIHAGEVETLSPRQQRVKNAERALLIVKVLVEGAHKAVWSEPLRLKASQCEKNEDIPSCMGDFTPENNQKIIQALEIYSDAARVAADAILLANKDPSIDTIEVIQNAVTAGLSLLAVIPKAGKYVDKLENLMEGLL